MLNERRPLSSRTVRRASVAIAATAAVTGALVATEPFVSAAPTAAKTSSVARAPLTAKLIAQLSQHVDQHVIVIMKNQLPALTADNAIAARSHSVAAIQAPLLKELREVHATSVKSYSLVDSFAATVSAGERARLAANSAVAKVIPDVTIRGPELAPAQTTAPAISKTADSPTLNTIPGACGANGAVQLDPEGLSLTDTDSTTASAKTARSLGITGAGVKVAFIADGVDPNNINFIRANNSSAFSDYQDFSGDGPGQQTSGDEAFLDANTIAGQGLHVYNVQNFGAQADPSACNIRIEGVAPGASLVGLDVFGEDEDTTESSFLEAINYAVETDHVNVINESFGSNPFPDVTALDATSLFDQAAVKAGVVVTVSSGDAGSTNTIGSPSDDPAVIGVGASTDFRFYAQTNYAMARYFATSGWLNDNISSLSSGGYNEKGGTIDMVAPGDLSFASCDASPIFSGCVNFQGQSSDVEESGGTSEASPFVAGAAALVIQAYRNTHSGDTPTPAVVKQILLSTTQDVGAPATEQGSGLLDSYKAVQLAESIDKPVAKRMGNTLMLSKSQLNTVGAAGKARSWPLTITNTGAHSQTVSLSGRTVGRDTHVQTGKVTLNDSTSPQLTNYQGLVNNYQVIHFKVPAGQNRLVASIAYPGNPANGNNSRVRMILIDPRGRLAAHTLPQGVGNYGSADVTAPVAGTWTGVIFGDVAADGGTNGTIPWRVATERYVPFGSIHPAHFVLAPGAKKTVTVRAKRPKTPGDSSGSIVVASRPAGGGATPATTIPVTLRSLVDVAKGGKFSGVLTGGNGRPNGEGQVDYYSFTVGSGVKDIMANVALTNDPNDPVGAYLVGPNGDAAGFGQNSFNGVAMTALTAYALHPVAGRWTLVVDFAEPVVGNEVSQSFSGAIKFNAAKASATGLPDSASTQLAESTPVTVPVKVTNTGAAPEDFFFDARLAGATSVTIAPFDQASGLSLPLTGSGPEWLVPPETSAIKVTSTASLPIMFDYSPDSGDPDLASSAPGAGPLCATTEVGSYHPSSGQVTTGIWSAAPTECGPYAAPAPAGTDSSTMVATTKPIDTAVTSPTGDFWTESSGTVSYSGGTSPAVIDPGKTATIQVTITPAAASGSTVTGDLYVDDFISATPPYGAPEMDEVAALPYKYTVK